jgi:predicted nucleotidyltransferase
MQQLGFEEHPLEVVRLEQAQRVTFQNLTAARERSASFRTRLEDAVQGLHSADVTIVCFGSLARDEFTAESDVDWTVLVDGYASPKHLDLAHQVRGIVDSLEAKPPGREAIFGNIAFSHAIIHQIGGEDDTNRNTTQRILLAL